MKPSATIQDQMPEDAKAAILDYINDRLCEWATWAQSGWGLRIGYPPCSLEYRLMTEGHVNKEYQGLTPTPEHADAEEIEALICEMAAQHHKMAQVIRVNYLERGDIRGKARKIGVGHTHFEMHLTTSRWWLAGRLSEKNKVKKLTQHFMLLQKNKEISAVKNEPLNVEH